MSEGGFPDGIDPRTGERLELTFDLGGTSPHYRQVAELMIEDMRALGIRIKPILNNKPRFFQKVRQGQTQLFRLSWVGDYPDAENFLQLFHSANAGACNRANYSDPAYDEMYEAIRFMPDSPERTARYTAMGTYLTDRCAWIFEGHPVSYRLTHGWLENYQPHDFGFTRWKYLAVDEAKRESAIRGFTPLDIGQLR